MEKMVAAFMALYLGIAFFQGFWDGRILGQEQEDQLEGAGQFEIASNPGGTSAVSNPVNWFTAARNTLSSWAGMLALQGSFFPEGSPQNIIRYVLWGLISIPVGFGLVIRFFGR